MSQLTGTGLQMADGNLDSVHAQQREDNSKSRVSLYHSMDISRLEACLAVCIASMLACIVL
jgi:hypothetical protein